MKDLSSLDLINYIKSTIDIISTLKYEEIIAKNKKDKNENMAEDYESLLVKEEASIRQHIALENKLKLEYEILNERINSLETENNILKIKIKKQKETYENKIEEINKQITDLNNMKNDIQKNERKLRKKLDLKEKEIFQLQSKLNSLNNYNNINYINNGAHSNSGNINILKKINKLNTNINSNLSFYERGDCSKEIKIIQNNDIISNNNISIDKINNIENINNEIIMNIGRNKHFSSLSSNSVHHLNKCNSISKINNISNILSEKESLLNDNIDKNNMINYNNNKGNNILNSVIQYKSNYNNYYMNKENISDIKNIRNNVKSKEKSNNNIINNDFKNSINNINNNKIDNDNIIIEKINKNNNINNSIDVIKVEQTGNNYTKINDNKILLINQVKTSKLKRNNSAINNNIKNNFHRINSMHNVHLHNQKDKLKIKRDITPDKDSIYNQNNNSLLKLNDNINSSVLYLLKKTPRKISYKNSMPNIKGINIHKNINREINKFQYLSNKIGANKNLISNSKGFSHSHLKLNEKKISPQDKNDKDNTFNFNNTNIINNKIIQKEGNINNNIIIINGEIVEQNSNKGEYPLISINKNNISLRKVSFKNLGANLFNKNNK